MKKSIATVIAAISFLAACGTCGALECDVISPMDFIIRCAVCFACLFASLRVVRDEERFEVEAARRSAARAERRAKREQESRSAVRVARPVALVRR